MNEDLDEGSSDVFAGWWYGIKQWRRFVNRQKRRWRLDVAADVFCQWERRGRAFLKWKKDVKEHKELSNAVEAFRQGAVVLR